jgi:hypothetical protein
LGITSLADAKRYDLTSAALETSGGSVSSAKFTTAKGRTFVGPTNAGLEAGGHAMVWNKKVKTWVMPYDSLSHTATGKKAYPGTMLLSTDVPTTGLIPSTANDLSKFLSFVAGPGQIPGVGNGELPPGYVPLTAANGFSNQVAYTKSAAIAVAKQDGEVPSSTGKLPGGSTPTPTPTPTSGDSSQPSSSTSSSPTPTSKPSSGTPTSTPSPTASPSPVSLGKTAALAADGLPAKALPFAGILAILAALGLGGVWFAGRRG